MARNVGLFGGKRLIRDRCQRIGHHPDPALEPKPGGALLLSYLGRFVLRAPLGAGEGKHVMAAAGCGREPGACGFELLMRVVLHHGGELERLGGVEGIDIGQRGLQASVGNGGPCLHRFPFDCRLRCSLSRSTLGWRHPLLTDADALRRHRVARGAESVGAGDRQVVDADPQHRIRQLAGCSGGLRGTQDTGAAGASGLGALDSQLQGRFQGQGGGLYQAGQHGGGECGRAQQGSGHGSSEDERSVRRQADKPRRRRSGSSEISDSKSARFEVDGIGRWPFVVVDLCGQVAAIGSKDRWHHQDMQDGGQRWRCGLDGLERQRHVGRVLMAQHRLGGIHAFTRLARRHRCGHCCCIGQSGTDIARQRQLREQQRDHEQDGRDAAATKAWAGHVRLAV
ncbi:hypothetical protein APY03_7040 [Variovorax sp. WDL1]|nr:hypothetical protein APY03_7040 [Variovorax sp. WDL1]